MENSYGVGTKNRFGSFLLEEDSDPFDIVPKKKKQQPVAPKVALSDEKENKAKKKKPETNTNSNAGVAKSKIDTAKPSASGKEQQPAKREQQQNGHDNRRKLADKEEANNRRNRTEINGHKMENGRRPEGERGPRKFEATRPQRRFEGEEQQRPAEAGKRFEGAPRRFADGERRADESGRGRGGRGGMGPRGRGGRGGRREFDRQSGSDKSGVRPFDKREGSGSYNWGSAKDQVEAAQAADQDVSMEDKEKTENTEEGAANNGPASETKEPEEPREMTLDEYRALQASKRVKPEYNLRKAGEGENTEQWKSTYVLKNKDFKKPAEKEDAAPANNEEAEPAHQAKSKTNVLNVLNINFQFSDYPRGRGRGRGRGFGRGRGVPRGRGGFNKVREQQAPKMDNELEFPSLH